MSVAGSTSSQGTRSRSPSRSRSPPYSDGRYPPSRYSRYESYNYRPNRNGMSAALDDYRDLRDRERDRDRDRSMGLMRDDRYLSPRARESLEQAKDSNKLTSSSSNNSIKDLKDDTKPITSNASEPYSSNRYMDWRDRDRDRERDRDRRYREDDRRRDYDRRGYMRDLRYEPSSYGGPPPPPMNYQIPPFGGDSYRPDRDRDREMPPSPNIPYYERDRLEDRDFYRAGRNSSASANSLERSSTSYISISAITFAITTSTSIAITKTITVIVVSEPEVASEPAVASQRPTTVSQAPAVSQASIVPQLPTVPQAPIISQSSIVSRAPFTSPSTVTSQPPVALQSSAVSQPPVVNQPQMTPQPSVVSPSESVPKAPVVSPEPPKQLTPPTTQVNTDMETFPQAKEQDSSQMEQGEVMEEDEEEMTQEQIVNRIDDIENELSIEEELLAEAEKREALEQNVNDNNDDDGDDQDAQNKEEAKKQALQAMENEPSTSSAEMKDFTEDASSMRKRPQLLINQLRSKIDEEDDRLYEKILSDNKLVAKVNGSAGDEEDWSDEEKWTKPLYPTIQNYPCYKENMARFNQVRLCISEVLSSQKMALDNKEKFLKKEYKALYEQWKEKNLALDRIRDIERKGPDKFGGHRTSSRRLQEQQPEEYTDGVIFTANSEDALRFSNGGASTPYNNNGYYTSDAARSEAELLEIIQSLESAEMRNPESRAKKTTATIPSMILDVRERMRTYDDRSGLVQDPLTYYHTGPDTGDVWNQQEVTTFMESYMMYPKQFERISVDIGTKTACQCVLFYYRKKKKIDFKALMKKGRRGKANKNRDRIAAAIRLATSDSSPSGRKAKSKGSALMTDIGEAQNSRKAKEKDAERKSKELRDLEQANQYWESVAERKKTKRPSGLVTVPPVSTPTIQSGPPSSASDDTDMMLTNVITEKRRSNTSTSSSVQQRRANKGKSPREAIPVTTEAAVVLPASEPAPSAAPKRYSEDQSMMDIDEEDDKTVAYAGNASTAAGVAKWSDREKELAVEAFKEHGRDFVQVSALVKSKTEEQCRNFYHNFKRKFGPNAFNEEDVRQTNNTMETTDVHSELVAISGRTDLKAEEEDAAAALVGMFQMGANLTLKESIGSRSRTPSGDVVLPAPVNVPSPIHSVPVAVVPPMAPVIATPPLKRRRVRSTSSRAESVTRDDTPESSDADYGNRTGGRKIGRTTSLSESKRPAYSSYWSVSERNEFIRLLSIYGRDWERVANEMKSKTVIQVRNFYVNNEEKMQLKRVVERYHSNKEGQKTTATTNSSSGGGSSSSFETSAHFQALKNFPFPSPIIDQPQPVVTPYSSGNRYFSSPPPPPPPPPPHAQAQPPISLRNNYPTVSSSNNRSVQSIIEPVPSAVTKVADLLNNDDSAEPNQKSWETWFGP
ncbi:hypothetical protein EDC94DRAFT_678762 [Helicostylum pulchrum]|nr:hypothetical protein EDC94DRAFT_678762 [Helicostylum pulchrum]